MTRALFLLLLLILPTFVLMLRPGVWSMHDFHLFRQYEFDQCAQDKIFPCRWSANSGRGYGQPVFNFYGQAPYWLGQLFRSSGFQIIDSVKISFALSLVLSGVAMYFLAKRFWDNLGGLISALFYVYAPYRAVDVWVRGALPESLAFVLFPLILLFLETRKYLFFSVALAALLVTHNLSMFMFVPFMALWWLIRSRDIKFVLVTPLSGLLAAFYLLPVILEKHLITISQTTQSYYNFQLHWVTLKQLFVSRFWGFGGSVWGPSDTLSFSAGHLHWLIPLLLIGAFIFFKKFINHKSYFINLLFFSSLGFLALFLTHGKSEFIWKLVPGMPYIQFPWRFLSMSTLFLSLSAGAVVRLISKSSLPVKALAAAGSTLLLLTNGSWFKPDIWRPITDREQFSEELWDEQRSSALSDFWPISAPSLPDSFSSGRPQAVLGDVLILTDSRRSASFDYRLDVRSSYAKINFPAVYFPGWSAIVNGRELSVFPHGDLGLLTLRLPRGDHRVSLRFKDTFARSMGNAVSAASVLGVVGWLIIGRKYA